MKQNLTIEANNALIYRAKHGSGVTVQMEGVDGLEIIEQQLDFVNKYHVLDMIGHDILKSYCKDNFPEWLWSKRMIRIGSKPRIVLEKAFHDMGHFFPSKFEVHGGSWLVSFDMYMKLLWFTEELPKDDSFLMQHEIEHRINLNPSRSTLMQYNGLSLDMINFERHISVMGKRDFAVQGLLNSYILTPIMKKICKFLNLFLYFKNKAEWKEWNKFYEKA
jgi:hypothetical protein